MEEQIRAILGLICLSTLWHPQHISELETPALYTKDTGSGFFWIWHMSELKKGAKIWIKMVNRKKIAKFVFFWKKPKNCQVLKMRFPLKGLIKAPLHFWQLFDEFFFFYTQNCNHPPPRTSLSWQPPCRSVPSSNQITSPSNYCCNWKKFILCQFSPCPPLFL